MGMLDSKRSEKSRKNGWTCPPHPLQLAAWLVLIVYAIIHFTTLAPALHSSWQPAAYIIPGISLVVHFICHIVACHIDPADPQVQLKKNPKLTFDRSKHKHVIENCHCYICQVDVAVRSKHCSLCNKCVSDFDHHCKWLNNCVGGRNYRWFLATLMTAMIALTLVTVIALLEFITYFTDQNAHLILQPYRDLNASIDYSEANFKIFYATVIHEGWLALLGCYFILGIVGIALLAHLFGFHMYLIYHKMSTYDYIIRNRDDESDTSSIASSKHGKKNRIMPTENLGKSGILSSALSNNDFQKILEKAEAAQRTEGETPPPSTSPLHIYEANNNSKDMDSELTAVKKIRKKKKKRVVSGDNETHISTIDHPQMYQNKGYTISRVDIPSQANPVRIMPMPVTTPRGSGTAGQYHSDSADSLLEVPTDKSLTFSGTGITSIADLTGKSGEKKKVIKKRVKPKKKLKEVESQSEDELNSTTMFTLNDSARLKKDGSLDYTNGFKTLPLTPTPVRKTHTDTKREEEIPTLDFSGLRGSSESVSFQPYTATFRSTDTVRTDRLLPVLREEKANSGLKPIADTEV